MHTQVQGTHTIQARPRAVYCRLVIITQPQREQSLTTTGPKQMSMLLIQ